MAWLVGGLLGLAVGLLGGFAIAAFVGARRRRSAGARRQSATATPRAWAPEALPLAILANVPIGVAVLNRSDAVMLDNEAGRQMGIAVAGKPPPPELLALARAARREGPEAALQQDMTLPSFGWRSQPLEVRVRVVCLTDGMVALLVEDVTESRRVEAVRRDFVANVGHEIKTPVGALALLAEAAVETSVDDREQMLRFLTRIRHEAARLSRLVTELIDLSRVQGAEARPDPAPVAVDDVLAEAVDRISPAAEAKQISVVVGGDHGGKVLGSESQLVTAVANLLENAIAYSPEATKIALAARGRGEWWEISVTDQGIGIPPEDLDRVFERFYRVDPARSRETGGTGLGLAIVKHIVNNHGGHVRVWSSPGSGSTFTLELPSATRVTR
ncbi:MAG TPA: ATP-binding protein [Frankiaceae bacterium]|nr:ATP-binding protein [Frankiaceae bacterium]